MSRKIFLKQYTSLEEVPHLFFYWKYKIVARHLPICGKKCNYGVTNYGRLGKMQTVMLYSSRRHWDRSWSVANGTSNFSWRILSKKIKPNSVAKKTGKESDHAELFVV
jgi:hypothetical protein